MTNTAGYPPIADHGLIGDMQSAALVSTDGAIDFFCCPRFDSASVFAALLLLLVWSKYRHAQRKLERAA